MLWLACTVGGDRFAIDATRVTAVLPAVSWKRVVGAPHGVVGLMNYHRTALPLIDLAALIFGTPSGVRMHTRILLVQMAGVGAGGDRSTNRPPQLLGLMAEGGVETVRCDATDFVMPDDLTVTAPYLGPVLAEPAGIIQRLEIDRLLTSDDYMAVLGQCAPTP